MSETAAMQLLSPFSRSTYVYGALYIGLRAWHVGATHVSKETATSICGTATGTVCQLIFFPVLIAHPESNESIIVIQ